MNLTFTKAVSRFLVPFPVDYVTQKIMGISLNLGQDLFSIMNRIMDASIISETGAVHKADLSEIWKDLF